MNIEKLISDKFFEMDNFKIWIKNNNYRIYFSNGFIDCSKNKEKLVKLEEKISSLHGRRNSDEINILFSEYYKLIDWSTYINFRKNEKMKMLPSFVLPNIKTTKDLRMKINEENIFFSDDELIKIIENKKGEIK